MNVERDRLIRALFAPVYTEYESENGSYLYDQGGFILTRKQWLELRARIDTFYAAGLDAAIEEHNQERLSPKAKLIQPAEPKPKKRKPGYVYLIHAVDTPWYKIGLATDTKFRLKQLGTQGPFEIEMVHRLKVDDMRGTEAYFHQLFHQKRGEGEWFTLSDEDIRHFVDWGAL